MQKTKSQLGQFFTTNTDLVLQGFEYYIHNKNVTDPFAGNSDLLNWAKKNEAASITGYDVDKRFVDNEIVFFNDSLKNPKKYEFVITNPPFLFQTKMAKNKLKKSEHSDLYQVALEKIMGSDAGIVIVPINFLCAANARYIRQKFLKKFRIVDAKFFTTQVFADTTYNVLAFYYKKSEPHDTMRFPMHLFPLNKSIEICVYKEFNYQICGEFLNKIRLSKNILKIGRIEESDIETGDIQQKIALNHLKTKQTLSVSEKTAELFRRNIVLLKAIDTGSTRGLICLDDRRKYGIDALVSFRSSRNQIELMFPDSVSIAEQEQLITLFNEELTAAREKYFSLFMTNFRDHNRKRISFQFAYQLLNSLYFSKIKSYAE